MRLRRVEFTAPPGWPVPPPGWLPPSDWTPDPRWPGPPPDWVFYRRVGPPRWVVRLGLLVLGLLVAAGVAASQGSSLLDGSPDDLDVGDCAAPRPRTHLRLAKVSCSRSAATLVVTAREEGTTDLEGVCARSPDATTGYVFTRSGTATIGVGERERSFVVCLTDR